MAMTRQRLTDGSRFRLRIDGPARVESLRGPTEALIRGEMIISTHPEAEGRTRLRMHRLAFAASSVPDEQGETGGITVIGEPADGKLFGVAKAGEWSLHASAKVHYPRLDGGREDRDRGCYYIPTFLPAGIVASGTVAGLAGGRPHGSLRLQIAVAAGAGEAFTSLLFEGRVRWEGLVPVGGDPSNHECHRDHQTNVRRLRIQPVGFQDSPSDANPSGSTAAAQFATARDVWGKCCVEFDVQPIHLISDATLKTSSNLSDIRDSYTDPDATTIEVFFVQNPLTAVGGGTAGAIGVATQKVVMAEPNGGNPVLLAHELGHALGLLHPPGSDPGTVMAPTGSAMNPGTELVTHYMCSIISQPALQTATETCCVHHDSGDHYIRDFPEDTGVEPSDPLPPGRTRYSMSNVWNRLTDTTGTFGPNGPAHENPARFQADGATPFTNYLFARVEQVEALTIRDAVVKFYLKHPGSGAGAVTLLGQVGVPDGLPQTVRVPWQVPAGTPSHSCVFAVVRSPGEPEDDPSGLTWSQFEALSRADNDWAQRNLDIDEIGPSNNLFTSAPWLIRMPPELELPVEMSLSIDTRRAEGLEAIRLEIPRIGTRTIAAGQVSTEQLRLDRQALAVIIHVDSAGRQEPGTEHEISVDPSVDDIAMTGFSSRFVLGSHTARLAGKFDRALAAFVDVANLLDLDPACRIAGRLRRAHSAPCSTTGAASEMVGELAKDLESTVEALAEHQGAEIVGLRDALAEFREALDDQPATSVEGRVALLERFFDLAGRIHIVVLLAMEELAGW